MLDLIRLRDAMLAAADQEDNTIINLDMESLTVCLELYREGSLIDVDAVKAAYARRSEDLLVVRREAAEKLPGADLESAIDAVRELGKAGIYVPSMEKHDLKRRKDNPVIAAIMAFRQVRAEVIDLEKILRALHPDDKIHARYNPNGAGTGRMSSRTPNLQNIRRAPLEEHAKTGSMNFRSVFIAPDEWEMIVADYNQAELRAAAVIAGEETMLKTYREGSGDLHTDTARVLVEDYDNLSKEDKSDARRKAKAVNFGLIFGQRASGLQSYALRNYDVNWTLEEAEEARATFFERYQGLAVWHYEAKKESWEHIEYGKTLFGRKRRIHPLSADINETWAGFCALTNHVVQGSCADMLKIALLLIREKLHPETGKLVGTVHDEILVVARRDWVEETKMVVRKSMEKAGKAVFGDEIPFVAEVKTGHSWACK